jgi:hypothetical protein
MHQLVIDTWYRHTLYTTHYWITLYNWQHTRFVCQPHHTCEQCMALRWCHSFDVTRRFFSDSIILWDHGCMGSPC